MTVATTETKPITKPESQPGDAALSRAVLPRLPFHPIIEERFGIDRANWKALVEAIFPNATTTESVILALSYCRARKLDPFKRNVHIVPIWNSQLERMVDTVWPGIGELRTTAFRTGEYAGRDEAVFGQTLTQKVGSAEVIFPEWCQVTVYRMIRGQRVAFAGPKVYWLETYATKKRNDDTPNEMWMTRPNGQVEKCAEAASLRAAFPEEIGSDMINDEVGRGTKHVENTAAQVTRGAQSTLSRIKAAEAEQEALGDLTEVGENGQAANTTTGEVATNDDPQAAAAEIQKIASKAKKPAAADPADKDIEAALEDNAPAKPAKTEAFKFSTKAGAKKWDMLCNEAATELQIDGVAVPIIVMRFLEKIGCTKAGLDTPHDRGRVDDELPDVNWHDYQEV